LHAPAAGFGETEFYPDFVDKAAVLIVRLAKNHPLPDGNKRVAWVARRLFVEINGWSWSERPSVDEAEQVVLAIAAGEWDEDRTAEGLRAYLVHEPAR
jgi:death-on-curing protein